MKRSQKYLLSQIPCCVLVSSPQNTYVFLRLKLKLALALNQNLIVEMASYIVYFQSVDAIRVEPVIIMPISANR